MELSNIEEKIKYENIYALLKNYKDQELLKSLNTNNKHTYCAYHFKNNETFFEFRINPYILLGEKDNLLYFHKISLNFLNNSLYNSVILNSSIYNDFEEDLIISNYTLEEDGLIIRGKEVTGFYYLNKIDTNKYVEP